MRHILKRIYRQYATRGGKYKFTVYRVVGKDYTSYTYVESIDGKNCTDIRGCDGSTIDSIIVDGIHFAAVDGVHYIEVIQ